MFEALGLLVERGGIAGGGVLPPGVVVPPPVFGVGEELFFAVSSCFFCSSVSGASLGLVWSAGVSVGDCSVSDVVSAEGVDCDAWRRIKAAAPLPSTITKANRAAIFIFKGRLRTFCQSVCFSFGPSGKMGSIGSIISCSFNNSCFASPLL